jgi:hypothetical protein
MTMDWQSLEAEALDLFHVVAPDLMAETAVRFVDVRRIPGVHATDSDAFGFVSLNLDLVARQVGALEDPPAGRFAAIGFHGGMFETMDLDPGDLSQRWAAFSLHELAHIIDLDYPAKQRRLDHLCTPAIVAEDRANVVTWQSEQRATMTCDQRFAHAKQTFHTHPASFFRIALHLLHRARADSRWHKVGLGETVSRIIGASEPSKYRYALGNEPAAMMGVPFRFMLERTPPPAAFSALWQADVNAHEDRIRSRIFTPKELQMSFFQTLKSLIRTKAEHRASTFDELAVKVADGKAVRPEDAAAALDAAGRSAEDLERAVGAIQNRRRCVAAHQRSLTVPEETRSLNSQLETMAIELDEKIAALRNEFMTARAPIDAQLRDLAGIHVEGEKARKTLMEMASDGDKERAAELRHKLYQLGKRVTTQRDRVHHQKNHIGECEERVAEAIRVNRPSAVQEREERSLAWEKVELQRREETLSGVDKQRRDIEDELQALEASWLEEEYAAVLSFETARGTA